MMEHRVQRVMGTVVSIDVVGLPAATAGRTLDRVAAWFDHVDATFSVHRETSLVSRVGRGDVSPLHPSLGVDGDELLEVLDRCAGLFAESDGVFDAWAVAAPNGARFDPSGYVKGWAVERAATILRADGATGWCINAGGDVSVGGRNDRGGRWRIGLQHPDDRDALVLVAEMPTAVIDGAPTQIGIATSGSYERGAHVIDARSGLPCTELGSATVVGPSIADADAYATIVYAMGEQGLAWLVLHAGGRGYEGCVTTRDGRLLTTPGFDALVPAWRHEGAAARLR